MSPLRVWAANYSLRPYSKFYGCGTGKKKMLHQKTLGRNRKLTFPPVRWCLTSRILCAVMSWGTHLPRLGLLEVFLPPRILKKPFPKDERAFFEPKPFSSMVALAGSVAEGHKGGFSLVLLISSFIFWETNNKHSINSLCHLIITNIWLKTFIYFNYIIMRNYRNMLKRSVCFWVNQFLPFGYSSFLASPYPDK